MILQEAESLVQEVHKTAGEGWRGPTVDKELARSVEFYQGSIGDAIEKANTDNARIYFQRIPSSVPQVQAAIMVTSTTPPGDYSSRQSDSGCAVSVQLSGQNVSVLRAECNSFEGRTQQF